jgi:hypothetical protein
MSTLNPWARSIEALIEDENNLGNPCIGTHNRSVSISKSLPRSTYLGKDVFVKQLNKPPIHITLRIINVYINNRIPMSFSKKQET